MTEKEIDVMLVEELVMKNKNSVHDANSSPRRNKQVLLFSACSLAREFIDSCGHMLVCIHLPGSRKISYPVPKTTRRRCGIL